MNAVAEQEVKANQPQAAESAREYVTPAVNILETKDAYILEAEMPGVNKEGLSINVEGEILSLTGRRQPVSGPGLLYRESGQADFRRAFELDPSIDTAKITAQLEQGILSVTLPKAEKAKPRQITVS
jgi:HSP20 family protein